ncbi:hypothetical protein Adt_31869 [Abeliophyllum distichum]|uniref:Uncharacterized protein n=1 Tax=Abeliophyllum distichum TaxID=126358 RepID=A0ABD1RFC7_9LAMI
MKHIFVQGPLPLGLSHLAACSTQGAQLRSRASPSGIRPHSSLLRLGITTSLKGLPPGTWTPSSLLLLGSSASLKGFSHWDSTTYKLAPLKEHSFVQGPLPLGLSDLVACSSQKVQLRSKASPTGTRPPNCFFSQMSTTSFMGLSHWNSAT